MKLCLIEDDLLLGKALTAALSDAGYQVTWVRTAADADRWIAHGAFDTAVLDLGLPDGDGMSVLARLRRDRPTLPVAIITARDSLQTRIDGLDAGADDLLVKPFATAELLARLRAIQRRSDRSGTGAGWQAGGAAGGSADERAQRRVDHAVAGQGQLAGKGGADHGGLEMDAVLAMDLGVGAGQAGFDQLADGVGVHGLAGGLA